jgi:hypothetical protein
MCLYHIFILQYILMYEILLSVIHTPIDSNWSKEELPDWWKESIIVPSYKKGDKTDCSNFCGILLLSNPRKVSSNILLSKLNANIVEIIWYHQCEFRRNRSTTDQIS